MWQNYIKTSLRSLIRNRVYATISVLGLALGISCAIMVALYIQDELSFESEHEHNKRIYRGYVELNMGSPLYAGVSPLGLGPTLVSDYSEFESQTRFIPAGNEVTIRWEDNLYSEELFWFADSTFFDVFSFEFISGDPSRALAAPNSLVINEAMAAKWFGNTDEAFGKTIRINSSSYIVTGITKTPTAQTEVAYNGLISLSTWPQNALSEYLSDWYRLASFTYVLAHTSLSDNRIEEVMTDFQSRYIEPFQQANGLSNESKYELRPLNDLHFYTEAEYDHAKGNMGYILLFALVGIFIVIIASINFVNLTLARSGQRTKEVGVRKTLGAQRRNIRNQFITESMIVALLATALGLAGLEFFLPFFNQITGKSLAMSSVLKPELALSVIGLWLGVGILSGFYPAFVLSKFNPVNVLKGGAVRIGGFGMLRKILIAVQFLFSVLMMIGTIAVYQQMQYMQSKNLGIESDQILILELPKDTALINQSNAMRLELLGISGIKNVSLTSDLPGRTPGELLFRIEQNGALAQQGIKFMSVDEHFIETMGVQLLQGRNFRSTGGTDTQSGFIINRTAATKFGWSDNPLGKRMQWGLYANDSAAYDGRVIGVVEDFHFQSLHNPIDPMVFLFQPGNSDLISIRIESPKMAETIEEIENVWKQFSGGKAFEWHFLDDEFDGLYENEQKMLTVFGYFAFISFLIALIGLFATASFSVQQRTSEIGIRKILGANLTQLIALISTEFITVVVLANIVSIPIAYFALSNWLESFAYRIEIHIAFFLIPAIISTALTMLIVGFHCWKANRTNPINAIRHD